MSARALVPLERDVRALVDGETVILVHDRAVLDDEVVRAAVEPVSVVACCLRAAGLVRLVSKCCTQIVSVKVLRALVRKKWRTVVNDEVGHCQWRRVRHAVHARGGVEDLHILLERSQPSAALRLSNCGSQ